MHSFARLCFWMCTSVHIKALWYTFAKQIPTICVFSGVRYSKHHRRQRAATASQVVQVLRRRWSLRHHQAQEGLWWGAKRQDVRSWHCLYHQRVAFRSRFGSVLGFQSSPNQVICFALQNCHAFAFVSTCWHRCAHLCRKNICELPLEDVFPERRLTILKNIREEIDVTEDNWDWYVQSFPDDFEREFFEFNSGTWWQMIQEKIGEEFAVGSVIIYSDVTTITKNLKIWAVYSKFFACLCTFASIFARKRCISWQICAYPDTFVLLQSRWAISRTAVGIQTLVGSWWLFFLSSMRTTGCTRSMELTSPNEKWPSFRTAVESCFYHSSRHTSTRWQSNALMVSFEKSSVSWLLGWETEKSTNGSAEWSW